MSVFSVGSCSGVVGTSHLVMQPVVVVRLYCVSV